MRYRSRRRFSRFRVKRRKVFGRRRRGGFRKFRGRRGQAGRRRVIGYRM